MADNSGCVGYRRGVVADGVDVVSGGRLSGIAGCGSLGSRDCMADCSAGDSLGNGIYRAYAIIQEMA